MRLRVGEHEVEGSVEEVAKLLTLLRPNPPEFPVADASTAVRRSDGGGLSPFISEAMAHDALTRRPLGVAHVKMLNVLHAAGDSWTSAPDLQGKLALTTREFAGLLGAFGKRLSHTDGVGSRTFFDQYWDHNNGYNLYRLPPSVRAALVRAKVV